MPRTKTGAGRSRRREEKIRWAVIGQGHFTQTSILPAFDHARENSELVAIFSGDERKRRQLARRHRTEFALPYEELPDFLRSGEVQAVYIAVPNHRHRALTLEAAHAGVHVLCEKPMAVTSRDCRDMIAACDDHRVKLMIAYRLHLERANLTAIEDIGRGRIGEPRFFSSSYSYQLDDENVRGLPTEEGGGPLYDIGIYCINAARYLFGDEPLEAAALTATAPDDERFVDTEEQVSAVLRFPGERLASFTVGFGANAVSSYTVAGSKGSLHLEPAYTHSGRRELTEITRRGQRRQTFPDRDQIAPELVYFADCILRDLEPEPSGWEGLHDVAIIEAILDSARTGRKMALDLELRRQRPTRPQAIDKPPAREPGAIRAELPRI
jgi:glucose-fructose oxidoreductase